MSAIGTAHPIQMYRAYGSLPYFWPLSTGYAKGIPSGKPVIKILNQDYASSTQPEELLKLPEIMGSFFPAPMAIGVGSGVSVCMYFHR